MIGELFGPFLRLPFGQQLAAIVGVFLAIAWRVWRDGGFADAE